LHEKAVELAVAFARYSSNEEKVKFLEDGMVVLSSFSNF
jgi:hypothetical protein